MNARRGGLGRGLDALIPSGPATGAFRMVDIGDIVASLMWQFAAGEALGCHDAADVNDDGRIDVADPVSALMWMLGASSSILISCGFDETSDMLDCAQSSSCPR